MILLNEKFDWNIFDYTKFKDLGVKYSFNSAYGNGYCTKPILMDINRKHEPSYTAWMRMLRCCFTNDESLSREGMVRGTVCEEWLDYAVFVDWYKDNYYELENEEVGLTRTCFDEKNTHFSPELCVFAPLRIIKALKTYGDNDKWFGKNGEILPKGIYYSAKNDYYTAWTKYEGETCHIGIGDNIIELQSMIKIIQKAELTRMAEEYKGKIPEKLYKRMLNYEYDMGELRYGKRNSGT